MKTAVILLFFLLIGSDYGYTIVPGEIRLANKGDLSKIRVGYFVAPPHIIYDRRTNKLSGAAFDLIENYIAPATGIKFDWEFEPSTIPRQLISLQRGKRYISILLIFVQDRVKFLIYSLKPYYYGQSIILVHKDNPLRKINSIHDIMHLVVGYAQNAYMTPFMRNPRIKFDLIANPNYHGINLEKLSKKRIGCVYSPGKGSMLIHLKNQNRSDEFRIIDLPEIPSPFHAAFSKDLAKEAVQFDKAFARLGGKALYIDILKNYIDVTKL